MDCSPEGEGTVIRFTKQAEPADFDQTVRRPGLDWLKTNTDPRKKVPDYWNKYRIELWKAFRHLCAYTAMYIPENGGHIDHFISKDEDRNRLYDWDNYRFSAGGFNSSKQDLRCDEILDPFDVEDDWFELVLPSLELVVTTACPPHRRKQAIRMCERLHLGRSRSIIATRQGWRDQFLDGELSLPGLERRAPLIARAIQKRWLVLKSESIVPEHLALLEKLLTGAVTLTGVREEDSDFAQTLTDRLRRLEPPVCIPVV